MDHPNGYTRLENVGATLPWNADLCTCGRVKDRRAKRCAVCHAERAPTKRCTRCGVEKDRSAFYARRSGALLPHCKLCACAKRDPATAARYHKATRARPGHWKSVADRITKRRHTDLQFRLAGNLRNALRRALKANSASKPSRTLDLLGCSIEVFKQHIEAQWRPGMSWSNWGRTVDCWQLDHKRPIASFDLTDAAQVQQCFHFSNYQPLWMLENAAKKDKI